MFKEERRHAIINLLIKDNSVSVSKLSGLYKVSQETIRSDLRFFQKSGMLQRCYGGGILNRDALSKLITENKIDISSTIATPIHQDAKLRRESTKKAVKKAQTIYYPAYARVISMWTICLPILCKLVFHKPPKR